MPTRLRRRKAARARRRRKLLAGTLVIVLAAGGALYLARSQLPGSRLLDHYLAAVGVTPAARAAATISSTATPCAAAPAAPGPAAGGTTLTAGGTAQASPAAAAAAPLIACPQTADGTPLSLGLAPPGPAAARRHPRAHGRRTPSPAPSRSRAAAPGPAASSSPAAPAAVQQVLALINKARGQAGLPAYTLSSGLDKSAAAHNALMAAGCGLSHQCQGEPSLGTRETAAGVQWTAAGENIGEGGPEPASQAAIARMAVTLTQDMLNEQPPSDGHRLNILSSAFHHIGIAVVRDSSGTVWLTQDFSS